MRDGSVGRFGPAAAALAGSALLFWQTRQYGLLGFDAYPLILTGRVASSGDLLSNLAEPLMEGRYPGAFYRPALLLTIAFDHAVWGLTPAGYQLTSALLFGAAVWALGALARRLAGGSATVAALVAALAFALHPAQVEVLPVLARRSEVLCCMFMALVLHTQLARSRLETAKPALWPAVLTLLAIASKETAFVLPALVFVAVLACSPGHGWVSRIRQASAAALPHSVAAALMLGVRFMVLGGIGGHASIPASTPFGGSVGNLKEALLAITGGIALPAAPMKGGAGHGLLASLLLAGAAAILVRVAGHRGETRNDPRDARAARAAFVALTWIGLIAVVHVAAGLVFSWHLLLPAAGFALLCGVAVEHLARGVRAGPNAISRLASLAALALLVGLLTWQARLSPLAHRYDEWERATAASRSFLDETRREIEAAPDGSVIETPPLPYWVAARRDRAAVLGAAVLTDYSVQAWAELALPERRVSVQYGGSAGVSAAPGEVLVRIPERRRDL